MTVPLWLIGMMGSGKTTAGLALSSRLNTEFVDTDRFVEEMTGRTIPEIWENEGEESFRSHEAEAVAMASSHQTAVVATGGGVVLYEPNVEVMRATGTVVWLDAEPATLLVRTGGGMGRPLLDSTDRSERLAGLAAARRPAYSAASHHRVVTDDRTVSEVVDELVELWTE